VNSGVRISDDPNRPDIRDYKHLLAETVRASADIPDSKITGGTLTRQNGLIQATPPNAKILSDPRNLPVIETALNKRVQDQTQVQKTNDQSLPLLMRWSKDSLDKTQRYETAKSDAANARGAIGEIKMYRDDLAKYDAAHPQQQAGPQKTAPPAASPADIKAVQQELSRRGLYAGPVDGKWSNDVNQGLNVMIHNAQTEGKDAGIYKGDIDLKYGRNTAALLAVSAASGSPDATDISFLKAMNNMYATGALQTVYKPGDPAALAAAGKNEITVNADRQEITLSEPQPDNRLEDNAVAASDHSPVPQEPAPPAATTPAATLRAVYDVVAEGGVQTDVRAREEFNQAAAGMPPAPEAALQNNNSYINTNNRQQNIWAPAK
jgi:hypothetical protein